jgi:hypothetical protein
MLAPENLKHFTMSTGTFTFQFRFKFDFLKVENEEDKINFSKRQLKLSEIKNC